MGASCIPDTAFRIGDTVRCVNKRGSRLLGVHRHYVIRERMYYNGVWFVKLEGEGVFPTLNFFTDRFVKTDSILSLEEML